MSDDPQISYSVKEVLTRIEGKVDDFLKALAFKADESRVQALYDQLAGLEGRVTAIEHERQNDAKHNRWRAEWRRWLIPTLLTAALVMVSLLPVFVK